MRIPFGITPRWVVTGEIARTGGAGNAAGSPVFNRYWLGEWGPEGPCPGLTGQVQRSDAGILLFARFVVEGFQFQLAFGVLAEHFYLALHFFKFDRKLL